MLNIEKITYRLPQSNIPHKRFIFAISVDDTSFYFLWFLCCITSMRYRIRVRPSITVNPLTMDSTMFNSLSTCMWALWMRELYLHRWLMVYFLKWYQIAYRRNFNQGKITCDQSPGTHLKGHGCLLHFCLVLGFFRLFDLIGGFLSSLLFFLRSRLPWFLSRLLFSAFMHLRSSATSLFSSFIFIQTTWRIDSPRSQDLEH